MTKELTPKQTTEAAVMEEMNDQSSANYVPSIKVTYGISPHMGEDGAKPGDFFLDGKNLGSSPKMIPVGYRFQTVALDDDSGDFKESLILTKEKAPDVRFKDRKEYLQFCKDNDTKDIKIIDGFDFLMYLPETNSFGVLFCSKHLADKKAPSKINDCLNNGSVALINTVEQKWKKYTWYTLNVVVDDSTPELPEAAPKMLEIYYSQIAEQEEELKETSGRDR
jgi:hypothetical protein